MPDLLTIEGPSKYAGVNIPEGVTLEVYQEFLGTNYQDPFWYGGRHNDEVMRLVYKDRIVFLDAPGDIAIHDLHDETRPKIRDVHDITDAEFKLGDKLFLEEDRFEWVNNNWFETFGALKDFEQCDPDGEVCFDYTDAVNFAVSMLTEDTYWEDLRKRLEKK